MRILTMLLSFICIVLFQNCGNQDLSDPAMASSIDGETWTPVGQIAKASSMTVQRQALLFDLDLSTGAISGRLGGQDAEGLCLVPDRLSDIQGLIEGAKVCEIERDFPEDTLCSMALIPAYATVSVEGEAQRFELGAATNGCRTRETNLCESSDQLEILLNALSVDSDFAPCE